MYVRMCMLCVMMCYIQYQYTDVVCPPSLQPYNIYMHCSISYISVLIPYASYRIMYALQNINGGGLWITYESRWNKKQVTIGQAGPQPGGDLHTAVQRPKFAREGEGGGDIHIFRGGWAGE
jgi:hypothetical protein